MSTQTVGPRGNWGTPGRKKGSKGNPQTKVPNPVHAQAHTIKNKSVNTIGVGGLGSDPRGSDWRPIPWKGLVRHHHTPPRARRLMLRLNPRCSMSNPPPPPPTKASACFYFDRVYFDRVYFDRLYFDRVFSFGACVFFVLTLCSLSALALLTVQDTH